MSALGRVVRSGVGRRRVQSLVMALAALMAVTAAVLAGSLIAASQQPFDHAFAQQNGAHLAVQFDGAKASAAEIAATAHVSGVTAAAGPYPVAASVRPVMGSGGGDVVGSGLPPMTVVGRDSPGGAVDDVTLTEGTWASGPGQIVLSSDYLGPQPQLGTQLTFPDLPGSPALTVVGVAQSVSRSADGWVVPAQIAALRGPGAASALQMLYRFARAGTDAQIADDRAAVAAALPGGAITGSQSYLNVKLSANRDIAPIVPFVVAFGVLGLIMSVLIVGSVVSGAVGAGVWRIGILKALGFTPSQVARAYLAQALIPSALGIGLGVVGGNLLAVPLLGRTEQVYGTGRLSVAPWIDLAVPAAALALVVAAALVPAARAGRLSSIAALAVGRTPRADRGRLARRVLARLPLPRAVSLGLANPFARPARALAIAAAIVFGATAVTFAVGLTTSLSRVQATAGRDNSGAVDVDLGGGPRAIPSKSGGPATSADPAAVAAAISGQPGTLASYGTGQDPLTVSGLSGATTVVLYQGDASWGGYQIISGHWFTGPGQAVVPTRFLQVTGAHLGDSVTLVDRGVRIPVRIVGEAFDLQDQGMDVLTDIRTLGAAEPGLAVGEFHIALKPGVNAATYVNTLNNVLHPIGADAQQVTRAAHDQIWIILNAMIVLLTLMLVAVAGLGVLNSVVLDTRDRVHDLGVYKAVGMTPRQIIAMVVASVAGIGLVAGAVGVPVGIALHDYILPVMGHAAGTNLPTTDIDVYRPGELALLGLAGIAIAVLGALLPAGWAAKARTMAALRTE
jgi:putative ABC transport system permease protein